MNSPSHAGRLRPVVGAPMAGGPTTPELVAAVGAAGGLGFLAAGYLAVEALRETIGRTRSLTGQPFGVNVFVPGRDDADPDAIATYATVLRAEADRLGVDLGDPAWDDDAYSDKIDLLVDDPPYSVSFTFGLPSPDDVARLHSAGVQVAVTVTGPDEAAQAIGHGADVLVVQGTEAGGHQGTFADAAPNRRALLDTLTAIRDITAISLVAAGGVMTAEDATAARRAGAAAVQLGTALLCTPEAGTSAVQRAALRDRRYPGTVLTRAFSGRWARGLANRFATEHADAPAAYPHVHHLTRPLRAAATRVGDPEVPNLWAGQGWERCTGEAAGEVVRRIATGLR